MLLVKTDLGNRVMKDRSVALTPRQRSAFILFDGKRSVEQVLEATVSMGVVPSDIDQMIQLGLLQEPEPEDREAFASAPTEAAPLRAIPVSPPKPPASGRTPQQRYFEAYPIATALTADLGLRGFRLNLAVEGAHNLEELLVVAPRIREAVGDMKYAPLDRALNG